MKRPKRLSAAFVRTVNRPGRYGEGRGGYGLSLLVKERRGGGLTKTWSQRLRISGKPSNLGRYPIVTLAEAREKALENARSVDQGRDPRDRSRIPTCEQAAEKVIRLYEPTWRTSGADSSAKVWRSSLQRYVFRVEAWRQPACVPASSSRDGLMQAWADPPRHHRRGPRPRAALLTWYARSVDADGTDADRDAATDRPGGNGNPIAARTYALATTRRRGPLRGTGITCVGSGRTDVERWLDALRRRQSIT